MSGIAHSIVEFLLPTLLQSKPKNMVPIRAPMDDVDAIHEDSASLIAPCSNGDRSDSRMGIEGDIHPMAHPWPRIMMLAENNENKVFNVIYKLIARFTWLM